jgi:hypothetical protein
VSSLKCLRLNPLFLINERERSLFSSLAFRLRDCLDKDNEKKRLCNHEKIFLNDSSIYIPFPCEIHTHTRARLHTKAQKRTQREKKKERFCSQSFGRKKEERAEIDNHTKFGLCILEKKCARLCYHEVNLFAPSRRLLREEEEEEARERSVALFQINRTKTRKLILLLLLLHPLKSATGERTARLRRRRR